MPIKKWAPDDRPREKMMLKGARSLSNAELVAILLGSGSRHESALELARKLLNSVDENLIGISRLSIKDMMKFKGIGSAKAITVCAALELGRRRREEEATSKARITTSKQAFEILQSDLSDASCEEFHILLLDRAHQLLSKNRISQGGIHGTVVDARMVFKPALEVGASAIILGHNHPSGNLTPSEQDIHLTLKLKEAAKLLDMNVLDHIIVGSNGYYSFLDEGKI